jgi:hypothetical protein
MSLKYSPKLSGLPYTHFCAEETRKKENTNAEESRNATPGDKMLVFL